MTDISDASELGFQLRIIFNICLIIAWMIYSLVMIHKMREKEAGSPQRDIFRGYVLFLFTYAITRVIFVFSDFEVRISGSTTTYLNDIFVGVAYSFGILGAIFLLYVLEKYLLHTRYIFSVLAIGLLSLSIISTLAIIPTEVPRLVIAIMMPGFFLIILLLYLYVAFKSSGEPRRRSWGIVAGLCVMMVGFLLGSGIMGGIVDPFGLYEFRILVEPFILIAGGAIFTFSQR